MQRQLLSLALTVDQHEGGLYFWRILESFDHLAEFETLLEGAAPFHTYIDALRAGSDGLAGLCEDPSIGPVDDSDDGGDEDDYP